MQYKECERQVADIMYDTNKQLRDQMNHRPREPSLTAPREHGHAQGIVVAIGLKMDRKDFGSNPHVTLWVWIGF